MKWRSGLALVGFTCCLTALPACNLMHQAGCGATPANSSPPPDLRSNNQANTSSSRTDSPYHASSLDSSPKRATGDVQRAPFAIEGKPRPVTAAADDSSSPSTYTGSAKIPEVSNSSINPPEVTKQSAYPGGLGTFTVPPYPENIPGPERFAPNPPLSAEQPKSSSPDPTRETQGESQPRLEASSVRNPAQRQVITWPQSNTEKKDATEQKAPPGKEAPLLAFVRLYLANRPEEALAQLSGYDKDRRNLLLSLLSAAVAVNEDGTKRLDPLQAAAIANQLKSMALPLFPKAALIMSKACLCKAIKDYGDYVLMPKGYVYIPQGHVQIYIELQNYSKITKENGDEIWLSSRVDFFFPDGQPVPNSHIEFPQDKFPTSTTATSRDTHRAYTFYLPQTLPPGRYTMKLQVQDMPTHRTVEHSFEIIIGDPRRRS
jgi:hypothetical protein